MRDAIDDYQRMGKKRQRQRRDVVLTLSRSQALAVMKAIRCGISSELAFVDAHSTELYLDELGNVCSRVPECHKRIVGSIQSELQLWCKTVKKIEKALHEKTLYDPRD